MIYGRIWKKYDRLRTYAIVIRSHVLWRNTVVYDTVYDRLRPYTESVTVDQGIFVCALAVIILAIIVLACWWGFCPRYLADQLRNIINESSEVEISSSDRSNPPEPPIPAIIKYSKGKSTRPT